MNKWLIAALVLGLAGCPQPGDETADKTGETADASNAAPTGAETPALAYAAMKDGFKTKDWEKVFAHCTEDAQAEFLFGMSLVAGFSSGSDEEKQQALETINTKHGLKPAGEDDDPIPMEQLQEHAMNKIKSECPDKVAFCTELMGWIEANVDDFDMTQFSGGTLGEVTIDGDTATAEITQTRNGQERTSQIRFLKQDGGWRFHGSAKS